MTVQNYEPPQERAAFIAIVGRPNVGKSSLLNRMLGEKVAIVSPKPQTTRTRIMGVYTKGADQIAFLDTPGLLRARNELGQYMVKTVLSSVSGVDAGLLVVEAGAKISPAASAKNQPIGIDSQIPFSPSRGDSVYASRTLVPSEITVRISETPGRSTARKYP